MTCGPQGYKLGQFIKMPLQFIKMLTDHCKQVHILVNNFFNKTSHWHCFWLSNPVISGLISVVVIRMHPPSVHQ
jgi:hypothetical protein